MGGIVRTRLRIYAVSLCLVFIIGILCGSVMAEEQSTPQSSDQKQTLKEFMIKKGMMTEEEAKTIQEPPVTVSYGSKGFEFATTDHRFSLAIGTRLQFLFTNSTYNAGGPADTSSFRIRRAKIYFNGHALLPDLIYKVQIDLAASPILNDAYIDWEHFSRAQVWVGQYKVPFNRQQIASTAYLQLVDRAITDQTFSPGRDIGITLHNTPTKELVEYDVGVYNGNGPNTTSNDGTGFLYVGRIVLYPLGPFSYYTEPDYEMTPSLKYGVGFAYNLNSNAQITTTETANVKTGTIDIVVKFHGVSLIVGLFQRNTNPNHTATPAADIVSTGEGINTQASVFVIPRQLEFSGRYAWINPDKQVSHDDQMEVGVGMNVYFIDNRLKFQTDFRRIRTQQTTALPATLINDVVRAQLQVML
jgi:phosphate-selective porin OprO/OprP